MVVKVGTKKAPSVKLEWIFIFLFIHFYIICGEHCCNRHQQTVRSNQVGVFSRMGNNLFWLSWVTFAKIHTRFQLVGTSLW